MSWQGILSAGVFLGTILLIAFDAINLTLASILGAALLLVLGVVSLGEAARIVAEAHATIALFIGGMIIVRAFAPTGIFEYLGTVVFRAAGGSGKRLLLSIVVVAAPICALLPNATTVILLGPLMIQVAELLEIDFVPLILLLVFVANSAGLLTLVGDPATFVVADSIGLGFVPFLHTVTPGAVLALAGLVGLIPFLFGSIWRVERTATTDIPLPILKHRMVLAVGGLIMIAEVVLFVVGERLPAPLYPATVALAGSAIALAVVHQSGMESVHNILRDIDWDTIVFFVCIFVIVGAMDRTQVMTNAAGLITAVVGNNLSVAVIATLFLVGALSAIVPNIPLVVALVPVLKGFAVQSGMAPHLILDPNLQGQLPQSIMPLFCALMYGGTLGGNATLIGASANIIGVGIAAQNGRRISFSQFARFGVPVTLIQLSLSAVYLTGRFLLMHS